MIVRHRSINPSKLVGDKPSRRGAALVELAVCLPLLTFLVFGSIEVCDLIFLRNSLVNAAYVGTLEIDKISSTDASVRNLMNQTLDAARVRGYQVSLTGPNAATFDASPVGSLIRVQIRAPIASNLRIAGVINTGTEITVNAMGVK